MSKRFNISSFIEGIIFIAVPLIAFCFIGMICILSFFFSGLPSDDYYGVLFLHFKEILILSLALLSFYLSFFLFTKNRLILKLMYKIKRNNLKRRLLYIVLLFDIILVYGLLTLGNPSYPTDIGQDNFLNASLSVLNFLSKWIYGISMAIVEVLRHLSPLIAILIYFIGFFLLPIVMPILIDILISYEPWVFIASLKQKTREKICRIYDSIPCTFLVWVILSLVLSLPFIYHPGLEKKDIDIECFIPICISVLITFPVVITDGMDRTVNFIKKYYIRLIIPIFLFLELIVLYFENIYIRMLGFDLIVMLIVRLTLYTPFKRRREENRAIRAEIKSELGI